MKRNRLYGFGAAITAALLCAVLSAQAAVPAVINYQSRLRTAGGVAIKTATNVSFSLYSAAMGGSKLWTESYSQSSGACTKVMPDANGYFSVQMGSCEAFPSTITFTTPLFLGVTIENDAEATPRVAFAPAPYAMNAVRVGNFVSDISAGTLTGEPLGTATLDTQGFHSAGLLLQGSGWDGSVAANTGFKVRTTATDASNYRLSFLNTTDGSESVSILNNGRVGIGIANPQSELEVAGIIYADDFRTRGGTISLAGTGTDDLIRFTRPKLFIGHTASVTAVSPVTNLIELKEDAVTFLQDTYFGKLVSIPSRQIKLGDNIFTFPIAAPGANDLVLTTDTEGELSWTPKSSGGGSGSVTSVELSAPSTEFLVAGSPVTDSGTLSLAWKAQQPNDILAGPASGAAADVPTFRKLDPLDIPDLTAAKITSGTLGIDLIPNLSADKITSGTLGIDRIPDIPSAKVTGVLDDTNIPVLDIAIKTSGTLAVTRGGTGLATTAQGDLIFSDAINSLARLTIGTTGKVLTVSSVGLPIWSDPTTNGTVTSVGLTAPSSILTVSGSPVTGSGDLALDLAPQSARKVFIGPLTGTEKPTFRDLTSDDIPDLSAAKITSGTLGIDRIPDIPSARVTGTLGVAQIPDLSADKITTGTLSADRIPVLDIATKTSGTLAVTRGGTGLATTAQGDILFSDAINSLATLRIGADGQILTVNSAGLPVWQAATAAGVTSVGLSLPSLFTVSGSPITASGTLSATLAVQGKNTFFGGPASGVDTAPDFRGLDPLDIPDLDAGKITSGVFAAARIPAVSSSSIPDLDADKITSGVFNIARIPNIPAANITGVLATSSIPSLDASKITSGTFGVAQGGTGLSTVGAAGTVLTSVGGTPQWSPVPAGLSGSGAFGQLAFWNASSTLAGNSKIIIDDTNSRLAIGTTASPATTLVVAGDTTVGGDVVPSTASAYDFGSTTKPVRSVYSDNLGSATQRIKAAYIDELYIYGGAGGSGTSTISATQTVFNGIAYNWPSPPIPGNDFVLTTDTNGNLAWKNATNLVPESGWRSLSGNVRLAVGTDKVGVGTATPATKLDVLGDIQASGFLSSGTGQIKFGGATYNFPTTLGSAGQVLTASSSGALAWQTPAVVNTCGDAATDCSAPRNLNVGNGISFTWRQGANQASIFDKDNGYLHINGKAIMITTSGSAPSLVYLGKTVDDIITGNVSATKLSTGNFALSTGAVAGKVLTALDSSGNAVWQAPASGLPAVGVAGQVLTVAGGVATWAAPLGELATFTGDKTITGSLAVQGGATGTGKTSGLTLGSAAGSKAYVYRDSARSVVIDTDGTGAAGNSGTVTLSADSVLIGRPSSSNMNFIQIGAKTTDVVEIAGALKVGAANTQYTFPYDNGGAAGKVLTTIDASGTLGWQTPAGALPASVTAGTVLAGPVGVDGAPDFRALTEADVPNIDAGKITTGTLALARIPTIPVAQGGTGLTVAGATGQVLTVGSGGALTWTTPAAGNAGTVTSVGLTLPSIFNVTGSPVTSSGVITTSLATQAANTFFAAPNGSVGAPVFRTLAPADIPALDFSKITTGTLPVTRGGTGLTTVGATGQVLGVSGGALAWITPSTSQDYIDGGNSNTLYIDNAGGTLRKLGSNSNTGTAANVSQLTLSSTSNTAAATTISNLTGVKSPMLALPTLRGITKNAAYANIYSAVANTMSFDVGGNPKMVLKTTGLEVTGTVKSNGSTLTSDVRLKKNVTALGGALESISKLKAVYFDWKDEKLAASSGRQIGFIAQDVEKIIPEVVSTDDKGYKGVAYGNLSALAIEGVKELDAKLDAVVPTVGTGVLEAGETFVTVATAKASAVAKVFVTPVGSTGGQALYVGDIVDGKYFTVKTDKAVRAPVRFNWMIVE